MRPKTRLDPLIDFEHRKEEERLREMAAAARHAQSAEGHLASARQAAERDHRRSSSASDWFLADVAHARALHDVRQAEQQVVAAHEAAGTSRVLYTAARARTEALRRVADARVRDILSERERKERSALDELSVITYGRSRAA